MKSVLSYFACLLMLVVTQQVLADMRKAPYVLYGGINTEMEIHWQLTTTAVCTFDWGTDTSYALGSAQTQEYGNSHQHVYTVPNLAPDMMYYYRVTAGQQRFSGSFRAAPSAAATDLKFMAYGDTRSYPTAHDSVATMMVAAFSNDSDYQSLVISSGDLVSDGNSETLWDSEFFSPAYSHIQALLRNLPYQSCMGNHEGAGVLFSKYFHYPFVASRYWSFDYGPAHFAVLDQYTSYGSGSAQLAWLTNDLATSTKPWKFIVLHEPGWTAGGDHENNMTVQNYIQPLCVQYHVAIVFGGHNHYYARAVVDNVQHLTIGGGGAPLYTPNPSYPHIVASSRSHHFCKIEIDGDVLHFTAITFTGSVIDTFSIARPPSSVTGQTVTDPTTFELYPVYPNPFNPSTVIRFSLSKTDYTRLRIYNVSGQQVETLTSGVLSAGEHNVTFDGSVLSAGVYFARLETENEVQTKKILLLK